MRYYEYDAIVVGSGAAGLNGACRIRSLGKKSVALITEGLFMGTSRNTGSDKQTYYKLGLGGDAPDSVAQMAKDLFSGGGVDGDHALCEAALSSRCFLHLAELGVPFPTNRYGEYVGYKTDHDPRARATSAGPLTSKFMTEALQKRAEELGVPIYDDLLAVEILKDASGVRGLLCLERKTGGYVIFGCGSVLLATGGPAGIYADSVYPLCHTGSTGLALSAGADLQNMTQWQYGLASVCPRWNVSGSYMQVLPRFVSVDKEGQQREFLLEYFKDPYEALSMVFLKGYQWPFDSQKVLHGSSVIDLLVYRETVLHKRKVYLDYRENPFGLETVAYEKLSPEAYDYLSRAGCCFGTPIQRLEKMNQPAIALYQEKGLSLYEKGLEIALCAQHNNGGIAVDLWWQTRIPGLFAAGECAGTHGIRRPGGSALNAGQVGSLRAAQYISASDRLGIGGGEFEKIAEEALLRHRKLREAWLVRPDTVEEKITAFRRRMSDCAGAIRDPKAIQHTLSQVTSQLQAQDVGVGRMDRVYLAYRLRDQLLTQGAVLSAMADYAEAQEGSIGSALYCDGEGSLCPGLEEVFRFRPARTGQEDQIQRVCLEQNEYIVSWRKVRPLPENENFFETVWRQFRENGNVY